MKTIKEKILVPMIIITVVCAVSVLLSTILLFNGYTDREMKEKISDASLMMENRFEMFKMYSMLASKEIAENPKIEKAVEEKDRETLLRIVAEMQRESGVEFCTITDASGTVLARTHDPDNYGDNVMDQDNVKSALSGTNLTAVEQGTAVLLSIRSGVPVHNKDDEIIGVISTGFRLDTNSFVDSVKSFMGCEVTVFLGDERISTTVIKDDGTRATGTKADEKVSSQVLSGKPYVGNVKILGRDAISKYTPIYGIGGKVIGMMFVGNYLTVKTDQMRSFIISGIIILLAVLALGIIITAVISRNIEGLVGNLINGIRNSTRKIESATTGLKEISTNLASGSSSQAASIEETSASMNETASMVAQNADNTKNAALLAQGAKISADKGKEKIQELLRSMDQLKESSGTVSKIIKTIDGIAFQTNLLAINATVEAARAGGDAGRSFSVVAEEVRNLARKSAESANTTSEIIEKNIALTNRGGVMSGEVFESLKTIVIEFDKLNEIINEINAASTEQSEGIKQINMAVSQMEKITQQNAAMAEEAAASSQNLNKEADTLNQLVIETSKLIKNFKAEDHF